MLNRQARHSDGSNIGRSTPDWQCSSYVRDLAHAGYIEAGAVDDGDFRGRVLFLSPGFRPCRNSTPLGEPVRQTMESITAAAVFRLMAVCISVVQDDAGYAMSLSRRRSATTGLI